MRFKSFLPPVSFQAPISKKWYVVCSSDGSGWVEVDKHYSWAEIEPLWDKIVYGVTKKAETKRIKATFKVEGSRGNIYKVVNDNGVWTCSCPAHGFGRGKDCKHIKNIKNTL